MKPSLFLYFLLPLKLLAIPIRSLPGLQSITIYEVTTNMIVHTIHVSDPMFQERLSGTLSATNRDFEGWPGNELYDVFYSDHTGLFGLDGEYITIEAVFNRSGVGGGMNIAGVTLDFVSGVSIFASVLGSFEASGSNYIDGSELKAVDCSLDTWTTMGNTLATARLRLTVGLGDRLREVSYTACRDDGFEIFVNQTRYHERNPSGKEFIPAGNGCDSLILVNLIFEECEDPDPDPNPDPDPDPDPGPTPDTSATIACPLYIPNAFTPNGDGRNETFHIGKIAECTPAPFHVSIFDRWGHLLYESDNPDFQWDGTYQQHVVSEGVYVWVIQYRFLEQNHMEERSGTVTLIR